MRSQGARGAGARPPHERRRHAIIIDVRIKRSAEATELFGTIIPRRGLSAGEQARGAFAAAADLLKKHNARLLQERVFATQEAMPALSAARTAAYGHLDDGVPPLLLAAPLGPQGPMAGLQIHAVSAAAAPQVVRAGGTVCGRSLPMADGTTYVALSGLTAPQAGSDAAQARSLFDQADACLKAAGASMLSVARTWFWLEDILDWYGPFNQVRNKFFAECGILNGDPTRVRLPASTGIGVQPAGPARCALDVVAVAGGEGKIEYFGAAGNQQSAFDYGSAFSRSSRAPTPAGKTIYISGTASIDDAGKTIYHGDATAQVEVTLTNVRAVLKDMGCSDMDVVHSIAYSKTPEVEKVFMDHWGEVGWPCISVVSDVCRDDLLFEVEAQACPGATTM